VKKNSEEDIKKDTNNEDTIKINSEEKAPDWLKGNPNDTPKEDFKIEDNKKEEPKKEENLEEVTKIDDSKIPDWLK
jgi:hypothetical protein